MGQLSTPFTGQVPISSITLSGVEPRLKFIETDAPTDQKMWDLDVQNSIFSVRSRTDADGAGTTAISIARDPVTPQNVGAIAITAGGDCTVAAGGGTSVILLRQGVKDLFKLYSDGTDSFLEVESGQFRIRFASAPTINRFRFQNTSGAGTASLFSLQDATGTEKAIMAVSDGANQIVLGSVAGDMCLRGQQNVYIGANGASVSAAFDTSAVAGDTRMMVFDVTGAALVRVSRGAADSGGAGFRVLRIPN